MNSARFNNAFRIFVSYSHADSELVRVFLHQLEEALKSTDVRVRLDWDHYFLKSSQNWEADLMKLIYRSDGAIAILTQNYTAQIDGYAFTELNRISDRFVSSSGFFVIPVQFQATTIPSQISRAQSVSIATAEDVGSVVEYICDVTVGASNVPVGWQLQLKSLEQAIENNQLLQADQATSQLVQNLTHNKPNEEVSFSNIVACIEIAHEYWSSIQKYQLGPLFQVEIWRGLDPSKTRLEKFDQFCDCLEWPRRSSYPNDFSFHGKLAIGYFPTYRRQVEEGSPEAWLAWRRRTIDFMNLTLEV